MTRQSTYPIYYPKVVPGAHISAELLNDIFRPLAYKERLRKLYKYFDEDEILVTTSFGANSVFLLYLLDQVHPGQRVYFIDTTYHFPETWAYKEQLERMFRLRFVTLQPEAEANAQTRRERMWETNPDLCCAINKVLPLEPVKARHKVWVSGLMSWQTDFRRQLRVFERQGGLLKFHPLLDLSEDYWRAEVTRLGLPAHPLAEKGYGSIGCTHCTAPGQGRSGRWQGKGKTECGLHPGFFEQRLKARQDKHEPPAGWGEC